MSDDPDLIAGLKELLASRTEELQRLQAEFTNFKRIAELEAAVLADQGTRRVIRALRPVVIEINKARAAGELTGPFAGVADRLIKTMGDL